MHGLQLTLLFQSLLQVLVSASNSIVPMVATDINGNLVLNTSSGAAVYVDGVDVKQSLGALSTKQLELSTKQLQLTRAVGTDSNGNLLLNSSQAQGAAVYLDGVDVKQSLGALSTKQLELSTKQLQLTRAVGMDSNGNLLLNSSQPDGTVLVDGIAIIQELSATRQALASLQASIPTMLSLVRTVVALPTSSYMYIPAYAANMNLRACRRSKPSELSCKPTLLASSLQWHQGQMPLSRRWSKVTMASASTLMIYYIFSGVCRNGCRWNK